MEKLVKTIELHWGSDFSRLRRRINRELTEIVWRFHKGNLVFHVRTLPQTNWRKSLKRGLILFLFLGSASFYHFKFLFGTFHWCIYHLQVKSIFDDLPSLSRVYFWWFRFRQTSDGTIQGPTHGNHGSFTAGSNFKSFWAYIKVDFKSLA